MSGEHPSAQGAVDLVWARARWALQTIARFPTYVRIAVNKVQADAAMSAGDYAAAERRLQTVLRIAPGDRAARLHAPLLMALALLRSGDAAGAAAWAPKAVGAVWNLPERYVNPAERAYLSYVGKLIHEQATERLGSPRTLDVGVANFDEIDLAQVRPLLREIFPLSKAGLGRPAAAPERSGEASTSSSTATSARR